MAQLRSSIDLTYLAEFLSLSQIHRGAHSIEGVHSEHLYVTFEHTVKACWSRDASPMDSVAAHLAIGPVQHLCQSPQHYQAQSCGHSS